MSSSTNPTTNSEQPLEAESDPAPRWLTTFVQSQLRNAADPPKAKQMKRYLKTDMPMYGVPRPDRARIERVLWERMDEEKQRWKEDDDDDGGGGQDDNGHVKNKTNNGDVSKKNRRGRKKWLPKAMYEECIQILWNSPTREEKYLAIELAIRYDDCISMTTLPLYEQMLREDFMWWDLVDPIAIHLVGKITMDHPTEMAPVLRRWIDDDDNRWIRRTAILAQLKCRNRTDEDLLFDLCRRRCQETEFFIRKAIGWALREYSKTAPDAVREFLEQEKGSLSGLSYREGSKHLIKQGLM